MNISTYWSILLFVCWSVVLSAQDEGFSDYRFAGLAQSPAEAGRITTQTQLRLLYRTQWPSVTSNRGFQSAYAAFQWQVTCANQSYWGLGVSAAYEVAGTSNFTRSNGNLSIAYHQRLGVDLLLAAGGEIGGLSYSLDPDRLRFDEQFDGLGYDPNLPHYESFSGGSNWNVDGAIGALLYRENGKWSIGFSINHLNTPTISFLSDQQFSVGLSGTVYGNFNLMLRDEGRASNQVNLHFLYRNYGFVNNRQGYAILGADLKVPFDRRSKGPVLDYFSTDLSVRLAGKESTYLIGDALIVMVQSALKGWQVGLSYDINISPISTLSKGFGAFEMSLAIPISQGNECAICPKF